LSVFNSAKSILTGRTKIGIAAGTTTGGRAISLDVTSAFQGQYNAQLPRYPVEADPTNPGHINDHVIQGEMSLAVTGILSGSLGLTEAIQEWEIPMTAEMKLRKLIEFQKTGAIIKLLGYGTDPAGVISKLASTLNIPSASERADAAPG